MCFADIRSRGITIKALRILTGYSQKETAKAIGVTANFLSLVESGRRDFSNNFIEKLSKFLKIPVHYFFRTPGEMLDRILKS